MKLSGLFASRPVSTAADRRGVVSTYVSMGIVSVLGLVAVSFASVMQTEYSQARDRQFNTQARYAAETAINDARQRVYHEIDRRLNAVHPAFDLLQKPYDTLNVEEWFDCGDPTQGASDYQGDLDNNIQYTCIEVDGRPVKLVYDDVNTDRSKNVLLQTRLLDNVGNFSQSNIAKLIINWQGPATPTLSQFETGAGHDQELPDVNDWTHPAPILRIQIIPLNLRQGWQRDDLNDWTRTYFLYPTKYEYDPVNPYNECINNGARIGLYSTWTTPAIPPCPATTTNLTADSLIVNGDCDGDGELACTVEIGGFGNGQSPPNYSTNDAATNVDNRIMETYECWNGIDSRPAHPLGAWINCDPDPSTPPNNPQHYFINLPTTITDTQIPSGCLLALQSTSVSPPCTIVTDNSTTNSDPTRNSEMAYIVLVRSIYTTAKVELSALNSNGEELRFVNQQINVTSTGRAGGLTYRLREVIPIRPKYNRPEYAIDSAEHVCKVLVGEPTTGISFDHSRIQAYTNPIGIQTGDQVSFCEELHPI